MIYNASIKPGKVIAEPTQEEIYNCPEYFGMSKAEIFADPDCPAFLKRILDEYPFDGRNNVVQVRPQDFRHGKPVMLGDHWHTDIAVRLRDGKTRFASSVTDFHLMVASWGGVVETEFIADPIELPDVFADGFSVHGVKAAGDAYTGPIIRAAPGQLIEYTSAEIHRVPAWDAKLGGFRLIIVAFDCDEYLAGGMRLQSISEKDRGVGKRLVDFIV